MNPFYLQSWNVNVLLRRRKIVTGFALVAEESCGVPHTTNARRAGQATHSENGGTVSTLVRQTKPCNQCGKELVKTPTHREWICKGCISIRNKKHLEEYNEKLREARRKRDEAGHGLE